MRHRGAILAGCAGILLAGLLTFQAWAGSQTYGGVAFDGGKLSATSVPVFVQWDSGSATTAAVGTTTMPSLAPHATSGLPVISLDQSTVEAFAVWGTMPLAYDSTEDLTLTIHAVYGGNVGADDAIMGCQWARLGGNGGDLDSALSLDTRQILTLTGNATGGKTFTGAWTLAAGDIDTTTAGERFCIVFDRLADRTDDDAAGDLRIHGIVLSQ